MKAALQGLLMQCNPRILRHVLDNHRSPLPDRSSGQSVLLGDRLVQSQRHQPDVILLNTVPSNRLYARRLAIDDAEPSQFEFPCLGGDSARLAEKLVPIAHADDQRVDSAQNGVDTR